MNWANTMAGNAEDAGNSRTPGDASARSNVGSEPWDPHQVWLTRVKQPRDGRQLPPNTLRARLTSQATEAHFRARATR